MDVYMDEKGLHIGSKTYVGEVLEDEALYDALWGDTKSPKYDTKVYHYPNGLQQSVKCTSPIFSVPIPRSAKTVRQKPLLEDEDKKIRQRDDAIHRAHSRIRQIILSNEWKYFLTITFDDTKVDAHNSELVISKLQKWLNNQTSRNGLGYVLIPEYHKKENRIHCHALVNGNLEVVHNGIYKVQGVKKPMHEDNIKKYHIPKYRVLYKVYNVLNWKYGFSTAIEVYGNPARLANYVLKYMTKETGKIFGKGYWCSKNIKLYPDIELKNIGRFAYNDTCAKQFYMKATRECFKYENNFGQSIEDMALLDEREKEVLKL